MFFKGQRDASVDEKGTCFPAEFHLWNLHDENRTSSSKLYYTDPHMHAWSKHTYPPTHTHTHRHRHKHIPNEQINREIKKLKCF